MKSILSLTAATVLCATAAFAQTATTGTQSVNGASGDAVYSLEVVGTNGVTYNCQPDIVTIDGVSARQCVRAGAGGGNLFEGGLTAGVAAGVVGVILVAAVIADDDDAATSTTGSGS
jgi:hypothetical protein